MTRPRLTPHQRRTLDDLRAYARRVKGWETAEVQITIRGYHGFGSVSTVRTLARKGYAEVRSEFGPRCGLIYHARATED